MSPRLCRLAALAAAFAPDRAARLLALVSTPTATASESVEYASALARAPRKERLAALAAAFPAIGREASTDIRAHALWRRLTREAVARSTGLCVPSASRTMVRTATARDLRFAPAPLQGDAGMPRVLADAC